MKPWLWVGGAWLAIAAIAAAVVLLRPPAPPSEAPAEIAYPSVAVLPFEDPGGKPADAWFRNGFSDALLDRLDEAPGLALATRTDSFDLEGDGLSLPETAQRLHVRYLVEGSVHEDGGRLRVTARLTDAETGQKVWSKDYDRDLSEGLKVQEEIARAVTAALTHRPAADDRRPPPGAIDPMAYRDYLRAKEDIFTGSRESLLHAAVTLQEVTRRQPGFADGFARLGEAYLLSGAPALAESAVRKALALDPGNHRAVTLYIALLVSKWRWGEAEDVLDQLQASSAPEDFKVLIRAAFRNVFADNGGMLTMMENLSARRPGDYFTIGGYGWALAESGDYRGAMAQAEKALTLLPHNPRLLSLQCFAAAMAGDHDLARGVRAQLEKAAETSPIGGSLATCVAAIDQQAGDLKDLRALADRLAGRFPGDGSVEAHEVGLYYQQAQDFDDAMVWYRKAYERREVGLLRLPFKRPEAFSPAARKLFDDPRWKALWAEAPVQEWVKARADVLRRFPAR